MLDWLKKFGGRHAPRRDTAQVLPPPTATSPLQGLWIDEPDAMAQVARMPLDASLKEDLGQFIRQGYTIIRQAVDPTVADQIVADAHRILQKPSPYVVRHAGVYADPASLTELGVGDRIIDLYAISPAARAAVFTPRVAALLQAAFGEPAIAMQSLYFEYGSQQAIHQDTAYVVSRRPLGLAAIWIALEDVAPGTGELCYFPGGHRFPHFLFGGERKHWIQSQDGQQVHQAFLRHLQDCARERGIAEATFLPRKGDVLVWHADLPHGGSRITQMHTRRSLVLHFAPHSVKAHYADRLGPDYHELPAERGHFFSCRHYLLQDMDGQGRAAMLFNGMKRDR